MKITFDIFWRFLFLGCISFGGPAAHIGYFQKMFVGKLKWLDQESYAHLLSLSQFLPGPGSSQLGFAIGMRQAGIGGGITAFLGFTLPSFMLMYFIAMHLNATDYPWVTPIIHGLKLLAVVVVADACITMYNSFCHDHKQRILALLSATSLLLFPHFATQIMILACAALYGLSVAHFRAPLAFNKASQLEIPSSLQTKKGVVNKRSLSLFLALLVVLPWITSLLQIIAPTSNLLMLFNQFFQAGSMVFGGGHVVLPLLQNVFTEQQSTLLITSDSFLIGYASAQAVPGPMFTLATYLGVEILSDKPMIGAIVATIAIFLPGFLLIIAFEKSWRTLANKPTVGHIISAINAAVVGILVSAFFQPILTSTVQTFIDLCVVIIGFYLLRIIKLPILVLVVTFIAIGLLLAQING